MSEWEDITIIGRDKDQSADKSATSDVGLQLGRQVFTLSRQAPPYWREIFDEVFELEPGRLGRRAKAKDQAIHVWNGPYIFTEEDAYHLKEMVAYANSRYRESLEPADLSGFDAFGDSSH